MRLGFNTFAMPNERLDEALPALAEIGFHDVELTVQKGWDGDVDTLDATRRAHLRATCDRLGLRVAALTQGTNMVSPDSAAWAESRRRLTRTVELAVDLAGEGAPPIAYTSSSGKPGQWRQMRNLIVDRFGDWADDAAARGARVALEPHVFHTVDSPERGLWVLDQVKRPNLGLCFDVSHFAIQGYPMEEAVDDLAPHAVLCHVKDQKGTIPGHDFVVPGDGESDYVRYLQAIDRAGYTGCVTVMISVMAQRKPGYDPFTAAKQSYQVLSKAFRDSGVALE